MAGSQSVVIIGGGVVGLATAYALWREGHDVSLVERNSRIAMGASLANGGQLSYRYVAPLASPNVPYDLLSWVGRRGSPVTLHPDASLRQWRWLTRFMTACTERSFKNHSKALLALALESQQELGAWRSSGLKNFDWRQPGKLVLYRKTGTFRQAAAHLSDKNSQQVLSPSDCTRLEPAFASLEPRLAGGIYTSDEEVADCHAFCLRLFEQMQGRSRFRLLHGQASLSASGSECRVQIDRQPHDADHIVLASGLSAPDLVRPLGLTLPIYALKGYSLTLQAPLAATPSISVTDYDNRVVYARHGDRLRIAAMVDMRRTGPRPENKRIEQLRRLAADTLPQAGPYRHAQSWVGNRPATPTSVPIIGRAVFRNLLLNVGHGALGFTLAPGSARRIADLF